MAWLWLGIAIVFALLEVLSKNLFAVWFAISAILSVIISLFISNYLFQFLMFIIVGTVLFLTLRGYCIILLQNKKK